MNALCTIPSAPRACQSRPVRRAFTLLELMVVVVLLGLAATIVTFGLAGTTEPARLRAATLELEQTLRLARYRAQTRHQVTGIVFQPGSARYRLQEVRAADADDAPWRALDAVTIVAGLHPGGAVTRAGAEFAVRLTPAGVGLPWALELQAGRLRRVIWSRGIGGELAVQDGIGLAEFRWASEYGDSP